jgi:hypothetical protein
MPGPAWYFTANALAASATRMPGTQGQWQPTGPTGEGGGVEASGPVTSHVQMCFMRDNEGAPHRSAPVFQRSLTGLGALTRATNDLINIKKALNHIHPPHHCAVGDHNQARLSDRVCDRVSSRTVAVLANLPLRSLREGEACMTARHT